MSIAGISVRDELRHRHLADTGFTTILYENHRQLLIGRREVLVCEGALISRKLSFESDIIHSCYTTFESDAHDKALVVALSHCAHVYYSDGRYYTVNLPFRLKNLFPFDFGLVLEKDLKKSLPGDHHQLPAFYSARFLTLVDPLGEFRLVSTSLTLVISTLELLLSFPQVGLKKSDHYNSNSQSIASTGISLGTLCATFNRKDKSVVLYHVRSLGRRKINSSSSIDPIPSSSGASAHLTMPLMQYLQPLVSMDKKRTSTLLTDVSSIARMSEPGFAEPLTLKKDLLWSQIDTYRDQSPTAVHILTFEDQIALSISSFIDSTHSTNVYMYLQTSWRLQQNYRIHHLCVPLNNDLHQGWLVALTSDSTLKLVHPFLEIELAPIQIGSTYPPISSILSAFGEEVALVAANGKTYILKLLLSPTSEFISHCLRALSYLSGSKIRELVWVLWCCAVSLEEHKNEWNAFVIVLLSVLYWEATPGYSQITRLIPLAVKLHELAALLYSFVDLAPYIVLTLHFLREEFMLDTLANDQVDLIGGLLAQLTAWMGWPETWSNYYMVSGSDLDRSVQFLLVSIVDLPPNLMESLSSIFGNKIIRYITFSELVEEDELVDKIVTPRTYFVLRFFELLILPHYGSAEIVEMMCEYGISVHDLDSFPLGIRIPLKEALLECQDMPTFEWTSEALEIVGRKDLIAFFREPMNSIHVEETPVNSIVNIVGGLFDKREQQHTIAAWDGETEAVRISIAKLIFDSDRRFYEITSLLHQTKVQAATLKVEDPDKIQEYDLVILQRELASMVALRTLTIPMGRAALFYASRTPLMTEKFPIPKFNFDCHISPYGSTIILTKDQLSNTATDWGYFHNGVLSGLSISRDSKGIGGLWLIFNKPPELNTQHAGFLLGLGLNGHLKKLEEWHIYNYLGPKHPLTSVGLLLGMSALLRGTMDNKLTKVLLVHAVALLPQGANDLNVPIIVQTAGLIGIGFLYLASQHRRMSEIMLGQISGVIFQNDAEKIDEGYRLAAGIALGMVNLGKGNDLKGLGDTHVLEKLTSLATSMKDFQTYEELDKSCCGAVMALGLIYLKTGKESVASKLKPPDSERLLDYIRPDILFIRCLAYNLILWDKIEPTVDWVKQSVPSCLQGFFNTIDTLDSDQLYFFNILGGNCMSIALKYALSNLIIARDTVMYFLDMMMKVSKLPYKNYDQKIAHHGACKTRNLLALCLSVVVAGTGDLETFRRLRVLYSDTHRPDMEYGSHMVINMGLGFLFLGGGQYAFTDSNFATACLAISMYPVFPSLNSDLEVHLQALRHFWALAVEPRCLVVRDVDSKQPCKVPILIATKQGQTIETQSPCLLPPMGDIEKILVKSKDHFEVSVDFVVQLMHLEKFKKSLVIYVIKRQGKLVMEPLMGQLLGNAQKMFQYRSGGLEVDEDMHQLSQMSIFSNGVDSYERLLMYLADDNQDGTDRDVILVLESLAEKMQLGQLEAKFGTRELWSLKIIFAISESMRMKSVPVGYIDRLRDRVYSQLGV